MKPRTTYVQVERAVTSRLCSPVETLPGRSTKSTSSGGSCEINPLWSSATSGESGDLTGRRWFSLIFCHWMLLAEWPCLEPQISENKHVTLRLKGSRRYQSSLECRDITVPCHGSCRYESALIYKCSYACSCTHTRRNTQLQCSQHTWTILKAFFPGLSVNNEGWNRRWTKHVVLFWRLKLSGALLGEFLQCLKYV